MVTKRPRKKGVGEHGDDLSNWIATLAKQQLAADAATNTTTAMVSDKASRIAKRLDKKRRREERNTRGISVPTTDNGDGPTLSTAQRRTHNKSQEPQPQLHRPAANSRPAEGLTALARRVAERAAVFLQNEDGGKWKKPYTPIFEPKKKQRRRNDDIQPRSRDYGGIGLVRPSLYIALDDPSWKPLLEHEFAQHIPGFFGKQRTKAMKKQLDGQMLWRQLLAEKRQHGGDGGGAIKMPSDRSNQAQGMKRKNKAKKQASKSPDLRIDALIQAGRI